MKPMHSIFTAAALLGSSIAWAAADAALHESIEKHGQPIAKMAGDSQTTYIFQCGDSNIREIYDVEKKCIESGCIKNNHEAAVVVPAVQPPPAPTPDPAPPEKSYSWLWFLLLIPLTGAVLTVLLFKRLNRLFQPTSEEGTIEEKSEGLCFEEASLRLSRNEMCFLKALHAAVHDSCIITFHESPERIIHDSAPEYSKNETVLKVTEPVVADFVLHNIDGSDVTAVVLLHDEKSKDQQKIRRINYLRRIFQETDIKVLIYPQNYQYDPGEIRKSLQKLNVHLSTNCTAA